MNEDPKSLLNSSGQLTRQGLRNLQRLASSGVFGPLGLGAGLLHACDQTLLDPPSSIVPPLTLVRLSGGTGPGYQFVELREMSPGQYQDKKNGLTGTCYDINQTTNLPTGPLGTGTQGFIWQYPSGDWLFREFGLQIATTYPLANVVSGIQAVIFEPSGDWLVTSPQAGVAVVQFVGVIPPPPSLTIEDSAGNQTVNNVVVIQMDPYKIWNITQVSPGVAKISIQGFSGVLQVCEGDGSIHNWTFENGVLQSAV